MKIVFKNDLGVMENFSKEDVLLRLANRIKELRLKKGVSQQDAYHDTGIHFGRIEQGKRDISYTTILRLCEYFEMDLKTFLS